MARRGHIHFSSQLLAVVDAGGPSFMGLSQSDGIALIVYHLSRFGQCADSLHEASPPYGI